MASSPINLQQFCELAAGLPSIADIKNSDQLLSSPDASAKVVRIGDGVVVKYGKTVSSREAETLAFIRENTDIPVPCVYASFSEPQTGLTFIVMEFVPGQNLAKALSHLDLNKRTLVEAQLSAILSSLRTLPSPGYIGSVGRQKCEDGCFWVPQDDAAISGPFGSQLEMLEGILHHLAASLSPSHTSLMRDVMFATLSKPHGIFFTHGDFQPKNLMIDEATDADGSTRFHLTVIDWETSGWYPEYWEFCNAVFSGRFQGDWLDTIRRIMSPYFQEYLMMEMIRSILFC